MKKLWLKTLALSLGIVAPVAYAADPTPVVTLERPVAVNAPAAPGQLPYVDQQVRPTAFSDGSAPVVRGQIPDATLARPLPSGPLGTGYTASTWRHYDDATPPAETMPAPRKVGPTPTSPPAPGGTVIVDDGGSPSWLALHNPFAGGTGGSWLSRLNPFGTADECDACPAGVDCGVDCGGGRGWHLGGGGYPNNRWYVSAEYLLWWTKGQSLPPLVTSGSLGDPIPGALGAPGTSVLFGGRDLDYGPQSGGRFMGGFWLCDDHSLGIDGGYFFLAPGASNFSATSGGTPILARPFQDAATGGQTAELVAGPNVLAGTVSVNTRTALWGAEANLRSTVCGGCTWYLDLLAGFRAMGLDDDLTIRENLNVLRAPGGSFALVDQFQTRNRFYGGQLGAEWQCQKGRWDFDVKTKLGLGVTRQTVNISGSDTVTDPTTGTTTFPGGLLTQPTNIGSYARNRFTYVPEVGFTVAYHVTDHLRLFAGYNFIYWSSVVRPGGQIDTHVNTNLIAPPTTGGPARPAFTFNGSDFWAQGVNVGLEYRW